MKQFSFALPKVSREHGGNLPSAPRRRRRPLSPKQAHHLVLKSDQARGARNLMKHHRIVNRVLKKACWLFDIRIYEKAIASNHIHLLVKGKTREDLQNFFRVAAGHIAQEILKECPLPESARGAPRPGAPQRENKFWQTRIYSRILTWGREFRAVTKYILQNVAEALGLIPYRERSKRRRDFS